MNERNDFSAWKLIGGLIVLLVTLALTWMNETFRVLDEERWTKPATMNEESSTAPESEAAR